MQFTDLCSEAYIPLLWFVIDLINSLIHSPKLYYPTSFSGLHNSPTLTSHVAAPPDFKRSCVYFPSMQDATCIHPRPQNHRVKSTEHRTSQCKPYKNTRHCGHHRKEGGKPWDVAVFLHLKTVRGKDVETAVTIP